MNAIGLQRPAPEPWVDTAPADASTDGGGWDTVSNALDFIPAQAWMGLFALLLIGTLVVLPITRRQARKAGARTAGHRSETDRKDRALFVASISTAAFFWLAVLAGSFRGLVAFGRDTLRWSDGWEYLVPMTLDGVAIAFGFLAFRAVRKMRSPERALRVVLGATAASAIINFAHEVGLPAGSVLGGGYLALLSLFGMLIFHELLEQFTQGAEWIRREKPKFGMRWLTWPSNTACAWVAWRNYPPTPQPANATEAQKLWWGSVNHAVAHLTTVRRAKRIARFAADVEDARLAAPWWSLLVPWVRVRQLTAALAVAHMSVAVTGQRPATRPDITSVTAADITTDIGPHVTADIVSGRVTATESGSPTGQSTDAAGDTMTVTATATATVTAADTVTVSKPSPRPTRDRTSARSPKWTTPQLRAFRMRDEDDAFTYAQIARKVNASEKTVSRWFKARAEAEEALRASVIRPDILSALPQPKTPVTAGTNGHSINEGGTSE